MMAKTPGTVQTWRGKTEWKYCKVCLTEEDTTPGPNNPMETAEREVTMSTRRQARTTFALPVEATDVRANSAIAADVRRKVEWEVDEGSARANRFPAPTKWVLTTQSHIYQICRDIDEKQKRNEQVDTGLLRSKQIFLTTSYELKFLPKSVKLENSVVMLDGWG